MHRLAGLLLSGAVILSVILYATAERLGQAVRDVPTTGTVITEMAKAQWISWTEEDATGRDREVRVIRPPGMGDDDFVDMISALVEGAPKKETWVSGGKTFMVVTPQEIGEDDATWCARHDSLVSATQGEFPPD